MLLAVLLQATHHPQHLHVLQAKLRRMRRNHDTYFILLYMLHPSFILLYMLHPSFILLHMLHPSFILLHMLHPTRSGHPNPEPTEGS
jgi:hypothetical protein